MDRKLKSIVTGVPKTTNFIGSIGKLLEYAIVCDWKDKSSITPKSKPTFLDIDCCKSLKPSSKAFLLGLKSEVIQSPKKLKNVPTKSTRNWKNDIIPSNIPFIMSTPNCTIALNISPKNSRINLTKSNIPWIIESMPLNALSNKFPRLDQKSLNQLELELSLFSKLSPSILSSFPGILAPGYI